MGRTRQSCAFFTPCQFGALELRRNAVRTRDSKSIYTLVETLVLWAAESNSMNVRLTPEQEQIVQDELKAGHFHTVEEVIGRALQILRAKEQPSAADSGTRREAVRAMFAFIEKNRVRLEDISVRELIHEGHRL
jgi:Arc/MetJ-type ribon-helix-helix transcriptional regulator